MSTAIALATTAARATTEQARVQPLTRTAIEPTTNTESATAATPARTAATILVIEDYPDTRELLSTVLMKYGYNVIEAKDGREGLLKVACQPPDLILMDLSLPEMDGIAVAKRIHETAGLSHIPIFAVSAYLTAGVEADVRAAGCVEMFNKPFDFDSLMEAIAMTLRESVKDRNSHE